MKKTGYSTKQNNITQGDHLLLKRTKIDIAKSQEHIKYEKNQKKKNDGGSFGTIKDIKNINLKSQVFLLCYIPVKDNFKTRFFDSTEELTNKTELNINVEPGEKKVLFSCF